MIGFIMLGNAGRFGLTGQIISSLKHRDKATNNALIAKAVEVCEQSRARVPRVPVLERRLAERVQATLRIREVKVPRYYVPLTGRAKSLSRLGAHRGLDGDGADRIKAPLKRLRPRGTSVGPERWSKLQPGIGAHPHAWNRRNREPKARGRVRAARGCHGRAACAHEPFYESPAPAFGAAWRVCGVGGSS